MGYTQVQRSIIPHKKLKQQNSSSNSSPGKYSKHYFAVYLGNGKWKSVGVPRGKRSQRGGYRSIDNPNKVIY